MSKPTKPHGLLMSPANQGGGSGRAGGTEDLPKRKRRPSAGTASCPPECPVVSNDGISSFPIQLHSKTILKLVVPAIVAIFAAGFTLVFFYIRTQNHVADPTKHLAPGERHRLETKAEARERTKRMIKSMKKSVKLHAREIKVEQTEQLQAATKKLAKDQEQRFIRILNEVRQTRRAVRQTPHQHK